MRQLTGLVLCGGRSARLGMDKSLIAYHGKPQWRHLTGLLTTWCPEVLVSCNAQQATTLSNEIASLNHATLCIDAEPYSAKGPMSGVLSAFSRNPNCSLLVVGCDYPLLDAGDLVPLVNARAESFNAICYHMGSTGIDLPFPAIYESTILDALKKLFEAGDYSLRSALKNNRIHKLHPPQPDHLESIDTLEGVHRMKELINRRT